MTNKSDKGGTPDRLRRLSMRPLPLEDALRGAMQVPPPKDDEAPDADADDEPEKPKPRRKG